MPSQLFVRNARTCTRTSPCKEEIRDDPSSFTVGLDSHSHTFQSMVAFWIPVRLGDCQADGRRGASKVHDGRNSALTAGRWFRAHRPITRADLVAEKAEGRTGNFHAHTGHTGSAIRSSVRPWRNCPEDPTAGHSRSFT